MVRVALITQTVVSVGATRLLAGMGLGAGIALIVAMVVFADELTLTWLTSASVPVLTDQRSTPHCANNEDEVVTRSTANSNQTRRVFLIFVLAPACFEL
jgi:hypothetical protein